MVNIKLYTNKENNLTSRKKILLILIFALTVSAIIGCFAYVRANNMRKQTKILDAVYMQTKQATESYIEFIETMENVVSYEKRYVEKPNWENINNLCIAIHYAKKNLEQVPTDTMTLTDEQLGEGRELGFDVSGLVLFCDSSLKTEFESNNNSLTSRQMQLENFMIDSTYTGMKAVSSSDEKEVEWNKKYLLLGIQNLWADFSQYGVREKLAESFPEYFDLAYQWETDKDILQDKENQLISEYEELLSEANRTLGNSEGVYEIEKEEGFKPAIIEGLPKMLIDPFFSADTSKTIIYKNNDNVEIDNIDIDTAVKEATKCTIYYENISYSEYSEYLSKMKLLKYSIKEIVKDSTDRITTVAYSVGKNTYSVKYENDTVCLDISNIDEMVLVPYWYICEVAPELLNNASSAKKQPEKNPPVYFDDEYVISQEDMGTIQVFWDTTLAYYDKKISATEKLLRYEKNYLDNPTIDNLQSFQIMLHLALSEFSSEASPSSAISSDIKNKMLSKEAYERAEDAYASAERRLLSLPTWKFLLNDYIWNSAYYNDAKHLLELMYQDQLDAFEMYKSYLTYNIHLVSQNLDEENRKMFLDVLYQKYPKTLNAVTINSASESKYFKIQSLENINYIYDKISEVVTKASEMMDQTRTTLNVVKTVIGNLGNDKECFTTPVGLTPEKAIPWVFSYTNAECGYTLFEESSDKQYWDITPDDVLSYSITYPNKTYEDALKGIERLTVKDIEVIEDAIDETEAKWKIIKNNQEIIYEWCQDKVTIYFPNKEFVIVPYGWYHYFR